MIATFDDGLVIEAYDREPDAEEALALDARIEQGTAFRLAFARSTFHRRAENFDDHAILVARMEGRIVGLYAVAFKDMVLRGETLRGAFAFDLRVDPDYRRRGIATRLADTAYDHLQDRARFWYSWIVDDNRAMRVMSELSGFGPVGRYRYQVVPTYRGRRPDTPVGPAGLDEVHEAMSRVAGPFDLYTDPRRGGSLAGHVASWRVRDGDDEAGCSAWDNSGILAEVVTGLPWSLRVLGTVLRSPLLGGLRLPHVPRPGEQLRSWYLFDAHATRPDLGRDLLRQVALEAAEAGIDYCYLVHGPWQEWVDAVRADYPRLFAPRIGYVMVGGWDTEEPFEPLDRVYVDIRDL